MQKKVCVCARWVVTLVLAGAFTFLAWSEQANVPTQDETHLTLIKQINNTPECEPHEWSTKPPAPPAPPARTRTRTRTRTPIMNSVKTDPLTNLPSITSSCIVLLNPVPYHSEVQIALHSYLLANGFPVCHYDNIDPAMGFAEWFHPPVPSSFSLSTHMPKLQSVLNFLETKVGKQQASRPVIFATMTPEALFSVNGASVGNPPFHAPIIHPHSRAIVIIHEPMRELEEHKLRLFDAISSNWTFAFLSPRVRESWHSGVFANSSNFRKGPTEKSIVPSDFKQQPHRPQSFAFVPVWQSPTPSLIDANTHTSPFIRTLSTPEDFARYIDWGLTFETTNDKNTYWSVLTKRILAKENLIQTSLEEIKTWKFIVVQGTIAKKRRDYKTLFQWMVGSKTLQTTPNAKILIIGRVLGDFRALLPLDILGKNHQLRKNILLFPDLTHVQYTTVLEHARAVFTSPYITDWSYVDFKSSGSVATAVSQAIPILVDSRLAMSYGEPIVQALVEVRNPDVRATSLNHRPLPPAPTPPPAPASLTNILRSNVYKTDTPGVIKSLDTFEEAVHWILNIEESEFQKLRKQIIVMRGKVFNENARLFAEAIHTTQVDL